LKENSVLLQLVQRVPSVDVFALGQRRLNLAHTILKINAKKILKGKNKENVDVCLPGALMISKHL